MALVGSLGTVTVNSSESKHVLFEVVVVVVESDLVATLVLEFNSCVLIVHFVQLYKDGRILF
jgi:hypothetical protein